MQIITGFEIPHESVKRVVEAGIARQRQVTHRRPVGDPADCEPSGRASTVAAQATMAKSPCRRPISRNAYPTPARAIGKRTASIISSTPQSVDMMPIKKLSAATRRDPRRDRSSISPLSVMRTSGSSALGSACATEPQTVPRLRVCACPTHGSAAARSGWLETRFAYCSTWRCLTVAPTRIVPSAPSMRSRPGSRIISMTTLGRAMRMLSMGISVCPPARTRASVPSLASTSRTSSRLSART